MDWPKRGITSILWVFVLPKEITSGIPNPLSE